MPKDPHALVWIDMEMTGLDPERDRIIEIATIITDTHLNVVAEGPVIAIHQSDNVLEGMDEWNTKTHNETGLVNRVRTSGHDEREAEQETLKFIKAHVPKNRSPLCGNSICQDRRFLARHMPELERWLHYRNLDVSTLKELARRWSPTIYEGVVKRNTHRALDDIRESIDELRHYREHFIVLDSAESPDEEGAG
ncbi:MAG: oligoribonuclease [Gammaproteobacteria bacterium]|nr:oligoribonuclease [Gammaproteobacteria bacterium]